MREYTTVNEQIVHAAENNRPTALDNLLCEELADLNFKLGGLTAFRVRLLQLFFILLFTLK